MRMGDVQRSPPSAVAGPTGGIRVSRLSVCTGLAADGWAGRRRAVQWAPLGLLSSPWTIKLNDNRLGSRERNRIPWCALANRLANPWPLWPDQHDEDGTVS